MAEPEQYDSTTLHQTLEEAHKANRTLLRQLSKEQRRHHEAIRAHNLTIANLLEMTNEQAALLRDRDLWKARAEGHPTITLDPRSPLPTLTSDEVAAIRKAIARLHHPDGGGDQERMKLWNALLDGFTQ
jgi:hypothetical protein